MENKQKNPRKRLNSLILLVAFTAIMLIVSTYAWFSAQKNVSIGNLEGTVNVAEGLMVSLDAKNWTQELNLLAPNVDSGFNIENAYGDSEKENNKPIEMLPVSTTGTETAATTMTTNQKEVAFYTGTNVNGAELHSIQAVDYTSTTNTESDYPGYWALDVFLQNSSKIDTAAGEELGRSTETLQLNVDSVLKLIETGNTATGLQNTVRMALAKYTPISGTSYTSDAATETKSVYVTASQSQILNAYNGAEIGDVAIWEPNAGDHVDYIVTNNNTLKLTDVVDGLYIAATKDATSGISKFTATEKVPTYALTAKSVSAAQTLTAKDGSGVARTGILDVYNWNIEDGGDETGIIAGSTADDGIDDFTGLQRQIALQTNASHTTSIAPGPDGETGTEDDIVTLVPDYSIKTGGVRNLISVKSAGDVVYDIGNEFKTGNEAGLKTFEMLQNSIIKLRLYLWLEGQDVDCINYASHGGGVHLDLGLVKSQAPGQQPS